MAGSGNRAERAPAAQTRSVWHFNWLVFGVEDLVIRANIRMVQCAGRRQSPGNDARNLPGAQIIGNRESDQRRAGAGRIECSEACIDA